MQFAFLMWWNATYLWITCEWLVPLLSLFWQNGCHIFMNYYSPLEPDTCKHKCIAMCFLLQIIYLICQKHSEFMYHAMSLLFTWAYCYLWGGRIVPLSKLIMTWAITWPRTDPARISLIIFFEFDSEWLKTNLSLWFWCWFCLLGFVFLVCSQVHVVFHSSGNSFTLIYFWKCYESML